MRGPTAGVVVFLAGYPAVTNARFQPTSGRAIDPHRQTHAGQTLRVSAGGHLRSSILRWLNIWKLDENIDENGPDKLFVGLEIIGHDWQMEGLPKNSVPQKTDGLSSLSASKWWQFLCPISRISGNNQRAWLLTLQILQVRYALVSIYAHGQGLGSNCVTLVSTGCYCCHFLEMFGDDFASIL